MPDTNIDLKLDDLDAKVDSVLASLRKLNFNVSLVAAEVKENGKQITALQSAVVRLKSDGDNGDGRVIALPAVDGAK